MRVVRNERRIRVLSFIGRYATLAGLLALLVGLVISFARPEWLVPMLVSIALAAYQRKLGERLGVKPGSELIAAVHKAQEVGAELVLADRDIQATLKRTWHNLSFFSKLKLVGSLLAAPFAVDEISEEQIEGLKDRDTISEMMNEFARLMPQVKTPLIDERDRYMMSSIQQAPGQKVGDGGFAGPRRAVDGDDHAAVVV